MTDNISDMTIHILRELQAGFTDMRARMDRIDRGMNEMRDRHDNLLALFGGGYREHERRIGSLELRVDKLEPTKL